MQRLNNAPILDQTEGQHQLLLLIALWMAVGDKIQKITPADIKRFNEAHAGMGIMFLHGHAESIDVGVVTPERARQLAAHHEATTSKASH